jgi:predicted enzyme related to lactoylglutathione lyase
MSRLKTVVFVGLLLCSTGLGHAAAAQSVGVGPQYDTTHVYVAADQLDAFATSFAATFGGQASKPVVMDVTPTPSSTIFRAVTTPAGSLSVFAFQTPIPYPFGEERTGYLVRDMDAALAAARRAGAEVVVAAFPDPIGRDAVIRWPGGVNMQLYWHTAPPSYAPLVTVPENRVYLAAEAADAFVRDFVAFSGGRVVADDRSAPAIEIGRPAETYRRIRLQSDFGKITVLVTDGHLPWPYGRELTGYAVADLGDTLAKAKAAGIEVLAGPYRTGEREAAMLRFPGGYIAEVHAALPQ